MSGDRPSQVGKREGCGPERSDYTVAFSARLGLDGRGPQAPVKRLGPYARTELLVDIDLSFML